jgi:hypothetical protein
MLLESRSAPGGIQALVWPDGNEVVLRERLRSVAQNAASSAGSVSEGKPTPSLAR